MAVKYPNYLFDQLTKEYSLHLFGYFIKKIYKFLQ